MRRTLPILLFVVVCTQAAAAQHLHPQIKSRQVRVERVAVLPVKVDVVRSGVKGGESMMSESDAIAEGVRSTVTRLLDQHGFTVLEDPLVRPGDAATPDEALEERRATTAGLQSRFDALAPQLMKRPKDVTKGRFTLGDEISGVLTQDVDALVFVRGTGVIMTKAKSFLQGGLLGMAALPKGRLTCDVVMVDARSGDVLFFSRVIGHGDIVKAAGGQVEKPLSKSLRKAGMRPEVTRLY